MTYIDGYLVPVPAHRKDAYIALGKRTGAVLKEYGALRIVECWMDADPDGDGKFHGAEAQDALKERDSETVSSFDKALKTQDDEVVVFSWTEWPDKATRDKALEAAMADPRMQVADEDFVFDGKRLIASGFIPILEL